MTESATLEERLEWWRRVSFVLVAIVVSLVTSFGGYWAVRTDNRVDANTKDVAQMLQQFERIAPQIEANTRAMSDMTAQLANLAGQLATLQRGREQ